MILLGLKTMLLIFFGINTFCKNMELLILFSLAIFMCFFFNSIFRFNKTVFILLASILVFLFVSFFIVLLGFEFLGLVFAMVYIGGIVVMFLFLILIVDVRVENTQKTVFNNNDFFFTFVLSFLFTIFFSLFFYLSYCPLLANNTSFYLFFNKAEICRSDVSFINFYKFNFEIDFDTSLLLKEEFKFRQFYNDDFVLNSVLNSFSFNEIDILGVTLFEQHGLLLCLIGLFLLIATIVAVILCLNIFN